MKHTIIAAVLFFAIQCANAQVNPKLAAYTKETTFDKKNQLCLVAFNQASSIAEAGVPEFINSIILNNSDNKVVVFKTEKDEQGFTHIKYNIRQNGILLSNKVIVAHCRNGQLISLNGDLHPVATPANQFVLSEKTALNYALKKINAKGYKWENKGEEQHMREVLNQPDFSFFPTGSKTIIEKDGKTFNAFQFTIYAEAPLYRSNVFVDATTGKVLDEQTLICNINVPGSLATKYSGTQTVTIDQNGSVFRLRESVRGQGVETYNLRNTATYSASVDFTNTTASYTGINVDQGARDAHFGAEKTYDYYFTQHNRNSIDNNGFKLVSYVHYNTAYANAFWDGLRMTYGDGSGSTNIFTALDVCGHEVSHGLTSNTSGLNYSNESGALNEAFSDIFGTCIENYARPNNWNWKMGEDLFSNASGLRNMANPNSFGDPDTYLGTNWYTGTGDNGGVHTNSGVANFWFYLLTTGGSGTNDIGGSYSVSPLGISVASKIAFRALTLYFTPTTDYAAARALTIQAAKDLYGNCSFQVEQTARAWYAVGVGPNYTTNNIAPNFVSTVTNFCSLPANANFVNTTSNGQSYTWDFGDGSVSTSTNPAHTYTVNGSYTVKLKAIGCTAVDSITKPSYVIINTPPAPFSLGSLVCGSGPVTLTASGTGNINWYINPFAQVAIGSGNSFVTPNLTNNTTFYVVNTVPNLPSVGGMTTNTNGSYITSPTQSMLFDVFQPTVLNSVVMYVQTQGVRTVELRGSTGLVMNSSTATLSPGANTVILNFNISPGTNYQLGLTGTSAGSVFRSNTNLNFPYNIPGILSITGSTSGFYYWFYNWNVSSPDCISPIVAVTASVFPAIVATISSPVSVMCEGESPVILSGSPSGGTFSGPNVFGNTFNPLTTGNFAMLYSYTDANGCSDTNSVNMNVENCTGINNIANDNATILIYPNPATDHLNIKTDLKQSILCITDASGRKVLEKQIVFGEQVVEINGLAKGLYLLVVTGNDGEIFKTTKLVKQ